MKKTKIVESLKVWRKKAKSRGAKIRGYKRRTQARKEIHAQSKRENQRLKLEVLKLRATLQGRGAPAQIGSVVEQQALCVLVVVCAMVSFRSVPRLLGALQPLLGTKLRIPHFTSVINWTLRVGIAVFSQVTAIAEPWAAIIDCSIDIGTRKALVVLRVPLCALQNKRGAIGPKDCECIGLEVSHQWNGVLVCGALTRIFKQTGVPSVILKDGGSDLKKGVELYCTRNPEQKIVIVDDLGHVVGNALKALYAASKSFTLFIKITAKIAARIRQTNLALFLPPKIRTKGRFLGITKLASWAGKILELLRTKNKAGDDPNLSKVRQAFAGLLPLRPFLKSFCRACSTVELFLSLLKTSGLNETTYAAAKNILTKLPKRSLLRSRLTAWLEKHIGLQRALHLGQLPLLVSSDAIESLFGTFKTIVQRNPHAELNKLIYTIPLLCGNHSYRDINLALNRCSHNQMLAYIEKTIPPTLRQQRYAQFKNHSKTVPKSASFLSPDSA